MNAKHFYLFGREKNHSKNLLIRSELFSTTLAKSKNSVLSFIPIFADFFEKN